MGAVDTRNSSIDLDHYSEADLLRIKEKLDAKLQKNKVSRFNNKNDLSVFNDVQLAELVKERLPDCTYDSVSVATLRNFSIMGQTKTVRKIEMHREDIYKTVLYGPVAFFSSLFKANSMYARTLNENGIKGFLLNSSEMEGGAELVEKAKTDILAAYLQYKTISIWVAEDCSVEAEVKITSGSSYVKFNINAGKFVRHLFKR